MNKTYTYLVQMSGFLPVSGTHTSSRGMSWDAEVAAVKHFMEVNAIEKDVDTTWAELIRFYAPAISYSSVR